MVRVRPMSAMLALLPYRRRLVYVDYGRNILPRLQARSAVAMAVKGSFFQLRHCAEKGGGEP